MVAMLWRHIVITSDNYPGLSIRKERKLDEPYVELLTYIPYFKTAAPKDT